MDGKKTSSAAARPKKIAIHIAYRDFRRDLALHPVFAGILFGLIPVVALSCLGAGAWLIDRDDILAAMMQRQAGMQRAYEQRIASLRGQIETLSSQQARS